MTGVSTALRIPAQTKPDCEAEEALVIDGVSKRFRHQLVLDDLNLAIHAGEFVTLLGPSGCGKSTTLNLIAGFIKPDSGNIFLRKRLANDLRPQQRRLGMVFQSWALFPHMTVFENIAYGLRARGLNRSAITGRVGDMLTLVKLDAAEKKFPSQLSGGMQQRVALARALVTKPDVLLLDEPLSNLDASLRKEMQIEIKRIHNELNVTTVLVTHSQEEALVMSDRVAVMRAGRIEQIAPPAEIYGRPRTAFVCTFVGEANLFEGTIEVVAGGEAVASAAGISLRAQTAAEPPSLGQRVLLAVRPESISLTKRDTRPSQADNAISAIVSAVVFMGSHISYQLSTGPATFGAIVLAGTGSKVFEKGEEVTASFSSTSLHILDVS